MKVKYRGVALEHGDSHLIVPALTLDNSITLAAEIDSAQMPLPIDPNTVKTAEEFLALKNAVRARHAAMRTVFVAAVRQNYPALTDEELSAFITLDNLAEGYAAAIAQSDRRKVKDPGELQPVEAAGSISTGAASTGA